MTNPLERPNVPDANTPDPEEVCRYQNLRSFYIITKTLLEEEAENRGVANMPIVLQSSPEGDILSKEFNEVIGTGNHQSGIFLCLHRRIPGLMEQSSGIGGIRKKAVKPIFVKTEVDPEDNDIIIEHYRRIHDNEIRIRVCAQTPKIADETCDFLEDTIDVNGWVYKKYGFSHFWLLERPIDQEHSRENQTFYYRDYFYYLRTSKAYARRVHRLKKIEIFGKIATNLKNDN